MDNVKYKNNQQLMLRIKKKEKTYYVKCRKDTENIDPKIV